MASFFTRREAVGMMGFSTLIRPAYAIEENTKRQFMEESLENVRKNGQKFERTTKMRFERIPKVTPFIDFDYYFLEDLLSWHPNPGQRFAPVRVPKGFVTDLASVPRPLFSIFPKTGRYAYAAIVHDYLYWDQARSRDEADNVLAAAMEDAKVDTVTINSFWAVLRVAGASAWDSNKKARAAGESRILAKFPTDPLTSWDKWRTQPGVFQP